MKQKEIGGFFELEHFYGNQFHNDAYKFNSGRNCLRYIIKERKIKEIYLPYLICESIIDICKKENVKIYFYHINEEFMPKFDFNLKDESYLYLINYYGYISNKMIRKISNKYKNIIVDNTQSFFQKPLKNIDTIYNCRKYFGVPDGAYLYTNLKVKNFARSKSGDKLEHLIGRFENSASEFYEMFCESEKEFENENISQMSLLTENFMNAINYSFVKKKRRKNYKYLFKKLKEINILKLNKTYGFYMYPFYVKNGDKLKKYLISNKVYIPTLWPNVLDMNNDSLEYDIVNNLIPIPIDQRYDIEDMNYIVNLINKFCKEDK